MTLSDCAGSERSDHGDVNLPFPRAVELAEEDRLQVAKGDLAVLERDGDENAVRFARPPQVASPPMALIGTETALRDIWYGRVWRAIAARVVASDGDVVALWMPKGSLSIYPVDARGAEVRIPVREPVLAERRSSRDALALERPGSRHSIWLFWVDGTFDYWYVNFERTLGWNGVCFDMVDEKLDLIVRPDGELLWKDEAELEHAGSLGLVDADEVRAEAAHVVAEWPFPTGWESFSPRADWSRPRLPRGWQSLG